MGGVVQAGWHTGTMRFRPRLAGLLALLMLAGCGGQSDAATLSSTLSYARDGGIAGVSERLSIAKDGRSRVSGGRKGTRSFRLPRKELDRIGRLVEAADLEHAKGSKDFTAADAFVYSIRYRGHKVEFDDPSIPDQLTDLLSALGTVVERYGGGIG
jgi:hypothetical protein